MPHFKPNNPSQALFLPVSLVEQLIPGTFEHALVEIVDHHVDLSLFNRRYHNDLAGAPAYSPAVLIKIVLLAYSRGVRSSRRIERLCHENVLFRAVSADSQPDFTTIAHFIASIDEEVLALFQSVLLLCAQLDLVGGELFALDGCKIASNASKEYSGRLTDLREKQQKLKRTLKAMIQQHKATDQNGKGPDGTPRRIAKMRAKLRKLEGFLSTAQPKQGKRHQEVQSNVTDNESARMSTSHGVLQGYNGMAMVDEKSQVIVHAEAFGSGQEHQLLQPMVDQSRRQLASVGLDLRSGKLLVDNGGFSEANLEYLAEQSIDAFIPDQNYRQRDPRFATAKRHRPKKAKKTQDHFTPKDFRHNAEGDFYICPNGKILKRWGMHRTPARNLQYLAKRYGASKMDCIHCPLRKHCLRGPKVERKTLAIMESVLGNAHSVLMRQKMDTPAARSLFSHRMRIVEPVFANIRFHKRLDYFTLRGKRKVDTQWKLFCLVHNIEKISKCGRLPKKAA